MWRGFVQSYTIHCYITRPMYSGSGKWSRSEGYTPYASHLQYMAHSLLGGTQTLLEISVRVWYTGCFCVRYLEIIDNKFCCV